MRAPVTIAAFLLAASAFMPAAEAHPPLWAPRVSLSLALDWNKLAIEAVTRPPAKPVPRVARHAIPKLTVTAAAPAPNRLDLAAYNRAQDLASNVLIPHWSDPDVEHRQKLRQIYAHPFTPYLGAWGILVDVETDALLR